MVSKISEALLAVVLAAGLVACGDDMGEGGGNSAPVTTRKAPRPPDRAKAPAVAAAVEEVPDGEAAGEGEGKNSFVAEG